MSPDTQCEWTPRERELILERESMRASHAVLLQALAIIAKRSDADAKFAQAAVKAADAAAINVRWEDLAVARANKEDRYHGTDETPR